MDIDGAIHAACLRLGYSSLRKEQEEAVKNFAGGSDVFLSVPTGGGKSLCYAILPWVFDQMRERTGRSVVIVVSPLIALMKDQVSAFTSKGLMAAFVGSEQDDMAVNDAVFKGQYQLVFISPESLIRNLRWREMLRLDVYQQNLVGLAIDEAHCVTKWGDFFRREFSMLGEVRSLIPPKVRIMALTATASLKTRDRVIKILGMESPCITAVSPHKANIVYWVLPKASIEEVFEPLVKELRELRNTMPRMIIFCRRYEECAALYQFFRISLGNEFTEPIGAPNLSRFRLVDMFTHPTKKDVKDSIITSFCQASSPLRLVICTVAFGMGIDCPNVRQVVHWSAPADIEAYLQETGRAGRDGLPACGVLFVGKADLIPLLVDDDIRNYCKETDVCRREHLFKNLDKVDFRQYCSGCSCCDVCAKHCKCSNCVCCAFPLSLK